MSSRDRQNQSNQPPYDAGHGDEAHVDMFIDEGWANDEFYEPDRAPPPRRAETPRPTPSRDINPTYDGTAAQINRLRRAVRGVNQQPPAPGRKPPGQPPRSRPAPGWRPDRAQPQFPAASSESPDDAYGDSWGDTGDVDEPAGWHSRPRRQARQARQPAYDPYAPGDDEVYGDESDDAGYYDEYQDDFSEYDAPRRRPVTRSRPQVSMPALSRPTLPPAIANAALVNDAPALALIGTGVASLVAMAILVANRVDSLAPGFATHVSASGVLEDVRAEGALWNLPLMATMLTLMAIVIAWFTAPTDRFASRFVLGGALLVQFVTWVALIRIL